MSPSDAKLHAELAHLTTFREICERVCAAQTVEEVAAAAVAVVTKALRAEGGAVLLAADPLTPTPQAYGCTSEAWKSISGEGRQRLLALLGRGAGALAEPDAAAFFVREGLRPAPAVRNLLALPLTLDDGVAGALVAVNLADPQNLGRCADDAAPLVTPLSHALKHVRALDIRARGFRILQAILENAESQLAYLDRDFRLVMVNSAYAKATGRPREELIGRSNFDFFPSAENKAIFERVRDSGEPAEYREQPHEIPGRPERDVRYWDWTLIPIKNAQGEVEGLVLSATDITDQVHTRQRLIEAQRARASMAETMAAEIHHRTTNNLALVAGLLQLQVSEAPDSPSAGIVRQAISRIRSLAAVHEQLRETRAESVELLDALRRIAQVGCDALSRAGVEVSVEGQPVFYSSKSASMLCVVSNELITNAIKHGAPDPGGKLRIKIAAEIREGDLHVSVWNSGDPVPRGFDPGKQKTMGLSLVRELTVRQHKGSLTIRPHDGGSLAEIVIADQALRREH